MWMKGKQSGKGNIFWFLSALTVRKVFYLFVSCRYAESVGAIHMHTSAKANRGLDEVFESLAQSK